MSKHVGGAGFNSPRLHQLAPGKPREFHEADARGVFRGVSAFVLAPLLSGCSHWELGTGIALGVILGVLAVAAALGLVDAVRSDFRGSTAEKPRRTFNLLGPDQRRPVRRRWAQR